MSSAIIKTGSGFFSSLDRHFAMGLGRIAGEASQPVLFAAALASRQVREGHTCLDFSGIDPDVLASEYPGHEGPPSGDAWLAALRASPLVAQVGPAGEMLEAGEGTSPLVLDHDGRLYLRRYFLQQGRLGNALVGRATRPIDEIDLSLLAQGLDRLFGAADVEAPEAGSQGDLFAATAAGNEPDFQRLAAAMAVLQRFCAITGGPGTGKTSTVAKILALLIEQSFARGASPPRIVLVAPTGKAAATLADAIRRAVEALDCGDDIRDLIPRDAATIHRCLGVRRSGFKRFRRDADNRLEADLVLVDEASMVDLALMTDLVAAIPDDARLILLGDEHQLASVEAGAVLGDICNSGEESGVSSALATSLARVMGPSYVPTAVMTEPPPLSDSIARLVRSYRYAAGSGIGVLARAINRGDVEGALAVLDDPAFPDVTLCDPVSSQRVSDAFRSDVVEGFSTYLTEHDPAEQLRRFSDYRVLCTHRRGDAGADEVNRICAAMLRRAGRIHDAHALFAGRPIMVTRNDYALEVFNGDVGVLEPATEEGIVRALFLDADGTRRRFAESRLPDYETAFAMTVHKSQGSEFSRVALLVSDFDAFQITRELIYTAVTRARVSVAIFSSREAIKNAIGLRINRATGLREALWRGAGV